MYKKLGILMLLSGFALAPGLAREESEASSGDEQRRKDVPLVIPAEEKNRKNPVSASAEAIEGGRVLFSSQCVMCHGARGDGKGDLAVRFGMNPPDFTDPAHQKTRTDGEFFYILSQGHGDMPGQGKRLPDDWRWELVLYVRSLAASPAK